MVLGATSIIFHIWLIFSGLVPSLIARPIHMALALPWIFIFSSKSKQQFFSGIALTTIGTISCGYIAFNETALSDQYGFLSGLHQFLIAGLLILITLEMARRAIGWPLPLISSMFIFYG
ncbi:MAG: TRAP transporter permease DctM/Q, partial [Candidatus Puniceispirillaceae bacterium]